MVEIVLILVSIYLFVIILILLVHYGHQLSKIRERLEELEPKTFTSLKVKRPVTINLKALKKEDEP